jgi:hypothetical protein
MAIVGSFVSVMMIVSFESKRDPVRGPWVSWITASVGGGLIELRADRTDAVTTGAARQTLSCKTTLLQPLIVVNMRLTH